MWKARDVPAGSAASTVRGAPGNHVDEPGAAAAAVAAHRGTTAANAVNTPRTRQLTA